MKRHILLAFDYQVVPQEKAKQQSWVDGYLRQKPKNMVKWSAWQEMVTLADKD
jgi:hypothetical protein